MHPYREATERPHGTLRAVEVIALHDGEIVALRRVGPGDREFTVGAVAGCDCFLPREQLPSERVVIARWVEDRALLGDECRPFGAPRDTLSVGSYEFVVTAVDEDERVPSRRVDWAPIVAIAIVGVLLLSVLAIALLTHRSDEPPVAQRVQDNELTEWALARSALHTDEPEVEEMPCWLQKRERRAPSCRVDREIRRALNFPPHSRWISTWIGLGSPDAGWDQKHAAGWGASD